MENDVLLERPSVSEVATARAQAHAEDLEIQITAHHGRGAALERSCSPPSSHHQLESAIAGGTVCEYHQQEVRTPARTSLLSPQERGNHLSESESTGNLSLSGHFQPRSPSQAAALAGTGGEEAAVAISSEVVAQIKALLEAHRLSRDQFIGIYDEYMSEREQQQAQLSFSMAHAHAQAQAAALLNSSSMVAAAAAQSASSNNNHNSSISIINNRQQIMNSVDVTNDEEDTTSSPLLTAAHAHEDDLNLRSSQNVEMVDIASNGAAVSGSSIETMDDASCTENSETPTGAREEEENAVTIGGTALIVDGDPDEENSRVDIGVGVAGDGSQVGKMQSLVRTALESYETASPVISEIGQKRKHFTLEEELRLQPSPFAQQLLE